MFVMMYDCMLFSNSSHKLSTFFPGGPGGQPDHPSNLIDCVIRCVKINNELIRDEIPPWNKF